MLFTV
jgi:hypothetical protein